MAGEPDTDDMMLKRFDPGEAVPIAASHSLCACRRGYIVRGHERCARCEVELARAGD